MKSILRAFALLCIAIPALHAFALERQAASDYHARRVHLAEKLNGGVAVLFAAEEPQLDFMPYRQDPDFYYLTGWNEPGAALLIESATSASDSRPARTYREILFLPSRNARMERYTGEKLGADTPGAPAKAGIDEVKSMNELPALLNDLVTHTLPPLPPLWSEPDAPQARSLAAWTATTLGRDQPVNFLNVRDLTNQLRAIKDPGEIALLHKASDASVQAQLAMMRSVHPGVTEGTVAGVIIEKLMENGCERASYAPIVGSGKNSTVLHYSNNSETMQSGDIVVVDAAGEYSMYASDITRTVPVNGHFTARQREIYDIVKGAQKAAMDAFAPGTSHLNDPQHKHPDSLDTVAWNYMNAHGKDLHGEPLGKYFIHGIGHSVGIDVHDPLDYSKPIQAGMVFTIEPGIYIPEEKIGVRIEDVFYANPNGKLECLTCALPKDAEEVEKTMKEAE